MDELLQFQHGDKLAGNPLSMVVAAGPYTLDDDLNYEPLEALVNVVIDERPDVLILVSRARSLAPEAVTPCRSPIPGVPVMMDDAGSADNRRSSDHSSTRNTQ